MTNLTNSRPTLPKCPNAGVRARPCAHARARIDDQLSNVAATLPPRIPDKQKGRTDWHAPPVRRLTVYTRALGTRLSASRSARRIRRRSAASSSSFACSSRLSSWNSARCRCFSRRSARD